MNDDEFVTPPYAEPEMPPGQSLAPGIAIYTGAVSVIDSAHVQALLIWGQRYAGLPQDGQTQHIITTGAKADFLRQSRENRAVWINFRSDDPDHFFGDLVLVDANMVRVQVCLENIYAVKQLADIKQGKPRALAFEYEPAVTVDRDDGAYVLHHLLYRGAGLVPLPGYEHSPRRASYLMTPVPGRTQLTTTENEQ